MIKINHILNKTVWTTVALGTVISLLFAIPLTILGIKTGFVRLHAAGANASLRMPATATVDLGNIVTVPLTLNTDGAGIRGVDVTVQFNTTALKLIGVSPSTVNQGTLKTFAPVTSTGQFDVNRVITEANTSGKLSFSALTLDYASRSVLGAYNGVGQLANLQFQSLVLGSTQVAFVFNSGATTDTNIVSADTNPQDLLVNTTQLTNETITVAVPPTPTPTPVATPRPSSTPTPTPTSTRTPSPAPSLMPTITPTVRPTPTPTPVGSPSPVVTGITLWPIADTYISSDSQSTVYGTSQTLYVDGKPIKKTFMKFDLSSLTGRTIKKATLRLRTTNGGYSGSPDRTNILISDNASWSEATTNYSNVAISAGSLIGSISSTVSDSTNEIPLTISLLQSRVGKTVTLVLDPAGEDALYFYSRETQYRPELVIEFETPSTIVISAAGTKGGGIYPSMDLLIKDTVVKTFPSVEGDPNSRNFLKFSYTHTGKVLPSDVKVEFTNDYRSWNGDRNLVVDKITIDGIDYQSEAPTIYGTGVWTKATGCTTGTLATEWLYCNGYFAY